MKRKLRVVIIEDEMLIAVLLAETVELLGHTVCGIAATQAEALTAAKLHHPDLLIVDAGLANGNGVDAVAAIVKTGFVPHLFVTGNVAQVRAQRPDAIILQKPFFVPELVAAITTAVTMPANP